MVPAVFKLPSLLKSYATFGGLAADACDQLSDAVGGPLIGPPQGAENPYVGSTFMLIPDILGDLEVRYRGIVGIASGDFSEVHDIHRIPYLSITCQ